MNNQYTFTIAHIHHYTIDCRIHTNYIYISTIQIMPTFDKFVAATAVENSTYDFCHFVINEILPPLLCTLS